MGKMSIDSIEPTKEMKCYICKGTLPETPWHYFCEVEGKVVARPVCSTCQEAQDNMSYIKRGDIFVAMRH